MNYQQLVTDSVESLFGPGYEFDFEDRFDHHGDSLDFLSLLMEIEDRLDIMIHEEDFPHAVTFSQLTNRIQEIHA